MFLSDAPKEVKLKIAEFGSSKEIKRKLTNIGLHVDDLLVRMNYSVSGPVLVQNLSAGAGMVALSRDLARTIIVNYER